MSTKIDLSIRRTFNYNSGWSHLDEWECIGNTRAMGVVREKNDGESFNRTQLFLVNSEASKEEVRDALMERERFGCQCEHDCCGHFFGSATNARNIPNTKFWVVKLSGSRNI